MVAYSHPEIKPCGALENLTYSYSRTAAEALLDSGGFPVNASTRWRYWDRNHNNLEEQDECLELKFFIRCDDAHRLAFGDFIADGLHAIKVRVNRIYNSVSINPLFDPQRTKDFHLFTGGWNLGSDPNHLILWNWNHYWHPGRCYNYAGTNNTLFNICSHCVLHANTLEQVKNNSWLAQEIFASEALCHYGALPATKP